MKKIIIPLLIIFIFPFNVFASESFPSFPMAFYGEVKLNNEPLATSTKIQVFSNNELKGEIILDESGIYGYSELTRKRLTVSEYGGSELIFKYVLAGAIGGLTGDVVVNYIKVFEPGKTLEFDLSFVKNNDGGSSSGGSSGGSGGSGGGGLGPIVVEEIDNKETEDQEEVAEEDEKAIIEEEIEENISKIAKGVDINPRETQLKQIITDAILISEDNIKELLKNVNIARDIKRELAGKQKYTNSLTQGIGSVDIKVENKITNFVVYGTVSTRILGAGERAGVINSYKSVFGKLPSTNEEWENVVKIANGRWPNERNEQKENKAKEDFKFIYKRDPNMENPNDNAAVTVIAYGLRPSNRNLDSEKAGIKIFKNIYNYNPVSAVDWDIVRAIAYSGAVR